MAPFCKHVCIQYTHVHAHFHVRMQSRKQNITDRVSLPVRESCTMLHSGPLQTEDPSILCQFGFSTSWDAEKLATVFRGCMMCGKIHWSLSFILVDPSWRFSSLMTLALGESRISPWRGTRDFQVNGHPVAIFMASLGMSLNPFFYTLWSCSGSPTRTPASCGECGCHKAKGSKFPKGWAYPLNVGNQRGSFASLDRTAGVVCTRFCHYHYHLGRTTLNHKVPC